MNRKSILYHLGIINEDDDDIDLSDYPC